MAFTIPDQGEGQSNLQSVLFQEQLEVLVAGIDGRDCVLSGCVVTAQGSPDMTVAVAKGAVLSNGVLKAVTAGNVTIGAADGTNPRIDLIVVDSSGAKAARAGTAAAAPKPPARSANDVVIAMVYVPASDTTIGSDQIYDLRMMRTQGPLTIGKQTTVVSFANTAAIQTYFTLTLPDGLFLAGKTLRVKCGGTFAGDNGSPLFTLTLAYGGTTMFADATGAAGSSPIRAWWLEFIVIAQGNADQALNGFASISAVGNVPAAGIGALQLIEQIATTPFSGSAAVDSDAADRDLTIQWTMSVAGTPNITTLQYATAEFV
jgi:hypothetical protein